MRRKMIFKLGVTVIVLVAIYMYYALRVIETSKQHDHEDDSLIHDGVQSSDHGEQLPIPDSVRSDGLGKGVEKQNDDNPMVKESDQSGKLSDHGIGQPSAGVDELTNRDPVNVKHEQDLEQDVPKTGQNDTDKQDVDEIQDGDADQKHDVKVNNYKDDIYEEASKGDNSIPEGNGEEAIPE
jgi:hypothetical protein